MNAKNLIAMRTLTILVLKLFINVSLVTKKTNFIVRQYLSHDPNYSR
jgi:hypothetical protein